jgi:autotransporter-associated beta strand protein
MKLNPKKCLALAASLKVLAKVFHRIPFRAAMLAAFILSATAPANANVYSWSGGGVTGNWSDSGNWGFAGVPANGDSLVFPAPPSLVSVTNDLANLSLAQIRFAGNGGGYTIDGNSFTLTVGIEATNTIGANTINNGITLGADIQVDVGNNAFLTLAGLLQGSGGVTKIGIGTLTYAYSGNNTYSGTTHVNAGLLQLNVNGVTAFGGPLVIGDGSGSGSPVARLLQSLEIADTQQVTVNLNGLFDLNTFSDTTGPLTIQGATVSTGSGTLSLNGNLTVLGSSVETMITGNLEFLGGMRVVNVADGPAFRDLDLLANVSDGGGGLLFTNNAPSGAIARLVGNNTFTGPLIVDNITLSAETPTALGATNAGTTVGSHGTLFVYSTGITNESLTMAGGATLYGQDNCTWDGPIVLNGNVTVDCYPAGSTLTLLGAVSGAGGFEKVDVGTLQLFGSTGNTYAGNTFIQAGICLIDKAFGTAIPGGTLTIGDQFGSSAVVRDVNVGANLGTTMAVAIKQQGLLDLNGEFESVGPITLSGGSIATGSGRLQINGDVTTLASTNTALINGFVLFAGGLRTMTVNQGFAPGGWDVEIPGTIEDAGSGIQIVNGVSGRGDLRLMGSNSFTGPLTVSGGMYVSAETPWALGATSGGTFVTNGATLFLFSTGITNETVTLAAGTTLSGQAGAQNPTWAGPIVLVGDATIYGFNYLGLFDITGPISGPGNLTVASDGEPVQFSGPLANTYTGTTTVAGSTFLDAGTTLLLNRTVAGNAIPGPLVINSNCVVQDLMDFQINSPFKPVTIQDTGLLNLTNHNEWIGALTLQGAQVTTGTGLLYLGGDITVNPSTVAISQITGNATLWNGTRTINCNGHNYSPDLRILANLAGNGSSGIIKTGVGEASLSGANNNFPGAVTVNAGNLWAASNNALGNTNTPATLTNNGSLFLPGNVAIGLKPLILAGVGGSQGVLTAGFGSNSWAGNITLATNVMIDVYTNSTLELSGMISGPGNLTKIDWGNLLLDGAVSNNFTGTTLLQQGSLSLSKSNGPAISGPLTIGQGLDGANGDVVYALQNNQLSKSNTVTISSSGLLDLSGGSSFNNGVGSVTGSGTVQIGSSSFSCGFDNSSTTYGGVINGTASGALLKVGNGAWTLTGAGSFAGILQVQSGQVFVNGSMPSMSASFINGALLGGIGTVGPIGFTRGILAPGTNGPGILNINSGGVTLNTNDTFLITINGATAGSGYSQLNVTGTVGLGNANLQLNMPVVGVTNSQLTIINNDGVDAVTGTFTNLPEGATITASSGAKFKISYHGGTGNDVVLTQISLPAQPFFNGITKLGGGAIQLNGVGESNLTYKVWANTNLATTNWVDIGTATANGLGTLQFTDPNATNYTMRFYRFSWP